MISSEVVTIDTIFMYDVSIISPNNFFYIIIIILFRLTSIITQDLTNNIWLCSPFLMIVGGGSGTSQGLLERANYKTIKKESGIFSLWQDNKTASTNCRNREDTVTRKQKDGTRITFTCFLNVIDYNKHMRGVDCNDQLRHYYCVQMKSHKLYKYIF